MSSKTAIETDLPVLQQMVILVVNSRHAG